MTDAFSEDQLQQFAKATRDIQALSEHYDPARPEAPAEFADQSRAIIESVGLDLETYDAIGVETQRSGALWERVQNMIDQPAGA
ncbi:DUF4168 domain-containing protein [Nocardia sp. NPDC051990]|uniref:DUF4168 domain-containing protein n=1 Tax=Nocardia sp. NPDC051990 TaxID=3155285 RepID=UPI00341AFCAD